MTRMNEIVQFQPFMALQEKNHILRLHTTTKETHDRTVPASVRKIALQLLSQDEGSFEGEIVLRL